MMPLRGTHMNLLITKWGVGLLALGMASMSWAIPITFSNTTPIAIPASGTFGAASPFPTSISVSGLTSVADVNATILGLSHTFPDDIYVVLEGPTGLAVVLWSDAGGFSNVSNIDVTFDDEAAGTIPNSGPLNTGSFLVSQFGNVETLPPPAPSPGFGGNLSSFDGLNPNGAWNLWIFDDAGADSGRAAGGWQLTLDAAQIPEPASLALLGIGLAGLGFARKKKAL